MGIFKGKEEKPCWCRVGIFGFSRKTCIVQVISLAFWYVEDLSLSKSWPPGVRKGPVGLSEWSRGGDCWIIKLYLKLSNRVELLKVQVRIRMIWMINRWDWKVRFYFEGGPGGGRERMHTIANKDCNY